MLGELRDSAPFGRTLRWACRTDLSMFNTDSFDTTLESLFEEIFIAVALARMTESRSRQSLNSFHTAFFFSAAVSLRMLPLATSPPILRSRMNLDEAIPGALTKLWGQKAAVSAVRLNALDGCG